MDFIIGVVLWPARRRSKSYRVKDLLKHLKHSTLHARYYDKTLLFQ